LENSLAGSTKQSPKVAPDGDLDRLYALLAELEQGLGGARRLGDCHGRMSWPRRGVYFFFESGEYRSNPPNVLRVVRIGTHALKRGSNSTLWTRLRFHRGQRNGQGNHRASVFRLHVGAALLQKRGETDSMPTWGVGSSAPREVRALERSMELAVSEFLGAMTLLWVEVDDPPGPSSDRAFIERNAIALLSQFRSPPDPPSTGWLGRYSNNAAIRDSGLWNVCHTSDPYDCHFLNVLAKRVQITIKTHRSYA